MPSAPAPARLLALLLALAPGLVSAQQNAPEARQPASKTPEQTIERIRHEDKGARIDELRVGGETKAITVSPKGNAPAYEVAPESNNRNPAGSDGQGEGKARWNILKY
jgi:starvation-inducible outer membrane lipoprotein